MKPFSDSQKSAQLLYRGSHKFHLYANVGIVGPLSYARKKEDVLKVLSFSFLHLLQKSLYGIYIVVDNDTNKVYKVSR